MKKVCPQCQAENIVLVQYGRYWSKEETDMGGHPEHIDGWSEIKCLNCQERTGRWTNNILKDDEVEPRYGGKTFTKAV